MISMLCDSFFHLIPEAFQMASYNFTNSLSTWQCFILGSFALMGMMFVLIVHTVLDSLHFYYPIQMPPLSCISQNKLFTKSASFSSIENLSPRQVNSFCFKKTFC
jgi:hypothetical protein